VRYLVNPYLSRGLFLANYDLGEGKVGLGFRISSQTGGNGWW